MRLPAVAAVLAALITLALAGPALAQEPEVVEITGVLNTIWGDAPIKPGPGLEPDHPTAPEYLLADDTVRLWALNLDPKLAAKDGGPLSINRHRVHVVGEVDPDTGRVNVRSIDLVEEIPPIGSHLMGTHVSGSQQWATILCRFGDATGVTPEPDTFFDDLMTFMDDYWRELSYDNINLTGSDVAGWYDMAQARAAYLDDPTTHFAGHTLNFGEIAQDCAAAADADLNFPDFDGINFIFNQDLDCCSWGGSITLNLDGMMKTYSSTWMATWGWGNQDVLGQEMGHGFGLPHSSGPYTATYDSRWDVMSSGGSCGSPDADFGCVGVHTVGFHKDALGWIPGSRRYLATTDPDQLVFLERLAEPGPGGYLVAQIPIGGSATNFYTVEARKLVGYDVEVPAEAVVMHRVDTTLGDRNAQVVDVDAVPNTSPNDAGARWVVGELFDDAANSISVAVVEETDTGFWIIINPTVADLSVTKTDSPDPVAAGTQLTYTVDVENSGPDSATGVQVVDTLPSEVSYVSDTGGCVEAPAGTLTCALGTLASGGSTSFDVTVDVPAGLAFGGPTFITNTAAVDGDTFDPDTTDNETTIGTQVIAVADVSITSFTASATPPELLIGDSVGVTLTKTIANAGPSSPVDVDVDVTSAPSTGLDVVPAAASQLFAALDVGEVGVVVEEFTLRCTGPGVQEVTFTNVITPVAATDPDPSDNTADVTVEIECVIPVIINIHPGSFPNSVNLKSKQGVIPVAILTTGLGEYGLPGAVDATAIDPLSVHFGPADVLFGVDPPGGATESHGRGHIEDSFELDEATKDGDLDLVLHFRAPETGLDFADSSACAKGQISIGGMSFAFFGCDSILPRP